MAPSIFLPIQNSVVLKRYMLIVYIKKKTVE